MTTDWHDGEYDDCRRLVRDCGDGYQSALRARSRRSAATHARIRRACPIRIRALSRVALIRAGNVASAVRIASIPERPHRRCWPAWPDLGERWPARLVATASEDRLSVRRNSHTTFAATSDCRIIAICEYAP